MSCIKQSGKRPNWIFLALTWKAVACCFTLRVGASKCPVFSTHIQVWCHGKGWLKTNTNQEKILPDHCKKTFTSSIQFNSIYLRRGQCKIIKHMIIHGLEMPKLAKRLFFICSPWSYTVRNNNVISLSLYFTWEIQFEQDIILYDVVSKNSNIDFQNICCIIIKLGWII